jgi:hypothetical protein
MGACAFGLSICDCPWSVWYRALGRTVASDRFAWRIHTGFFPPSTTSAGTATDAHRLVDSGLPLWLSPRSHRHWKRVRNRLKHRPRGHSRIRAMKKSGTLTDFRESLIASLRRSVAVASPITQLSSVVGRASSTMNGSVLSSNARVFGPFVNMVAAENVDMQS